MASRKLYFEEKSHFLRQSRIHVNKGVGPDQGESAGLPSRQDLQKLICVVASTRENELGSLSQEDPNRDQRSHR